MVDHEAERNFSEQLMRWLAAEGYTDCFLVPGGNAMYLIDAAQKFFHCTPVVHEVAAGIAAEYFNESSPESKRAFVIATAGPAVTNLVTSVYSSWLEGRELLIIAGQANYGDLVTGGSRQRGFQEIEAISLLTPIVKVARNITADLRPREFRNLLNTGSTGRPGPVFLEVCLDESRKLVSDRQAVDVEDNRSVGPNQQASGELSEIHMILDRLKTAARPVAIIGGQVSRREIDAVIASATSLGLPLATTINGFDRVPSDYPHYCGAPGWYGSRWSNLVIQQADFILALGTRLGVLETGYNWEGYAPLAVIHRLDVDRDGEASGRPTVELDLVCNPAQTLVNVAGHGREVELPNWAEWKKEIRHIRHRFNQAESANQSRAGFVEFMSFIKFIEEKSHSDDIIIPSSSGGAWEGFLRAFMPKKGQVVISDKGLASMGFGLSGGIGAARAHPDRRIIVIEGDGGFAQNLQELGALPLHKLNIKLMLIDNGGHASIRANQRANFEGRTIGCDLQSGLALPDWKLLARAYGLNPIVVGEGDLGSSVVSDALASSDPEFFIIKVDPEQINLPRISTSIGPTGIAKSNPLDVMTPNLTIKERLRYARHLDT